MQFEVLKFRRLFSLKPLQPLFTLKEPLVTGLYFDHERTLLARQH